MRKLIGYAGLMAFAVCGSCGLVISATIGLLMFYWGFKPEFKECEVRADEE